jgi:hypothetical protein
MNIFPFFSLIKKIILWTKFSPFRKKRKREFVKNVPFSKPFLQNRKNPPQEEKKKKKKKTSVG